MLIRYKWFMIFTVIAFAFIAYLTFISLDSKTPVVVAAEKTAEKTYEGTLFPASMGGYFAKINVKIDPSKEQPIQIVGDPMRQFLMEKQDINISKKYYATHDPSIDPERKEIFWSAYFLDDRDPAKRGVHYGKVDLKTGKVLFDGMLPYELRNIAPIQYCGSGQTKDKFLPVMMGFETFIDIIDKDTMKYEKRVFLDEIPEFKEKRYLWTHGTNSPDMNEFTIVTSLSDEGGQFPRGEETRQMIFILDMKSLLDGKVKVLRKGTITSDPKKSAFFRFHYTPDGRYLLLSNRDRSNVIDAKTLKEVAVKITPEPGWENHDFLPTSDGRYGILTQRVPIDNLPGQEPNKVIDGWLQLVDLTKLSEGKLPVVGKPTPVCSICHKASQALPWKEKFVPAVLCGIDGVWEK